MVRMKREIAAQINRKTLPSCAFGKKSYPEFGNSVEKINNADHPSTNKKNGALYWTPFLVIFVAI